MIDIEALKVLLILSMAVGALSMTVSKSLMFNPVVFWVQVNLESLGPTIKCPFCLGYWLSITFLFIFEPKVVYNTPVYFPYLIEWFTTLLALVAMSSVWQLLILFLFKQLESD
jgi:hypothetical protein